MKKKNGFTLIELLAVIVILAIIALIATPIILNLINEARKGAAKDSAYGVKKSAELYYSNELLNNEGTFAGITFTCDGKECKSEDGKVLNIEGTIPDSNSTVVIDGEGKVTYPNDLKFGSYTVRYNETNKKFEIVSGSSSTPVATNTPTPTPIPEPKLTTEMSQNGETYLGVLYLNPKDITQICDESITNIGQNATTEKPCMKWYIYGENDLGTQDPNDDVYLAILDHNSNTNWLDRGSQASEQLDSDSSTWETIIYTDNSDATKHARFITAKEIADITGNTSWTSGDDIDLNNGEGTSEYYWLYDYTYSCTTYGCVTQLSSTDGYWILPQNENKCYCVQYDGSARLINYSSGGRGVRPVIEIPKSDIQ